MKKTIYIKNSAKKPKEYTKPEPEYERLSIEPIKPDYKAAVPNGYTDRSWSKKKAEEYHEPEQFDYEEVPDPPEEEFDGSEQQEEDDIVQYHQMSFTDVNDGDYCLVMDNNLVCASRSAERLEVLLESLLNDGLDLSKIVILKKVRIKTGISLG